MTFVFSFDDGSLASRRDVLAVDGVFGIGPNLSHWPGNRTPLRYRHDLSTGMALRLAECPQRAEFVEGITTVSNNHYDTDGVLSAFACLEPERALEYRDAMLDAASAGDFLEVPSEAALRIDAIVTELTRHPESPIRKETEGLPSARRYAAAYAWILPKVPELLRSQGRFEMLWHGTVENFGRTLESFSRGHATLQKLPQGIAVIESADDLAMTAVMTLARPCPRVLVARHVSGGILFRFLHSTRSWFDQVTPCAARFELGPVAHALQTAESSRAGAWHADDITAPFAELGFGVKRERGDPTDSSLDLMPSSIPVATVVSLLSDAAATVDNPASRSER